jgi:hypothetical protein
LNDLTPVIRRTILRSKMEKHAYAQDIQEKLHSYSASHTRAISRVFLLHEGRTCINTSNGSKHELYTICYASPRIAPDIVGLKSNDSRQIGVAAADTKKYTKVACANIGGVCSD